MLTPSLAGALMGISSIGVMANSLALHLESNKFSSSGKTPSKSPPPYILNPRADYVVDVSKDTEDSKSDLEKSLLPSPSK